MLIKDKKETADEVIYFIYDTKERAEVELYYNKLRKKYVSAQVCKNDVLRNFKNEMYLKKYVKAVEYYEQENIDIDNNLQNRNYIKVKSDNSLKDSQKSSKILSKNAYKSSVMNKLYNGLGEDKEINKIRRIKPEDSKKNYGREAMASVEEKREYVNEIIYFVKDYKEKAEVKIYFDKERQQYVKMDVYKNEIKKTFKNDIYFKKYSGVIDKYESKERIINNILECSNFNEYKYVLEKKLGEIKTKKIYRNIIDNNSIDNKKEILRMVLDIVL